MRRSPAKRLAEEGRGWLDAIDGRPVLHTRGEPYEAGWQHGRLLREAVHACFAQVWRDGFLRLLPAALWYAYAQWNAEHLSEDEVAELTGLADGCGLPFDDVLLMNSQSPLDVLRSWIDPHHYGGCTQFAAVGRATRDGAMLIGRNLDTVNLYRLHAHTILRVHHPSQGHPFLTPGFPGKVLDAITGWNAAGLYVAQDDCEARWQNPQGLYSGALVRRMVQQAGTIEEAMGIIDRLPQLAAGARAFLLADGRRAVLAEVRQDVVQGFEGRLLVTVRRLGEAGDRPDTLTVTNHFLTAGQARRVGPPSTSSGTRLTRVRQLVDDAWSSLDVDGARHILTDKRDLVTGETAGRTMPSDNIINWFGPRLVRLGPVAIPSDLVVRVATTVSTVCDLGSRVMWLAAGEPWMSDPDAYRPYPVGELLAS